MRITLAVDMSPLNKLPDAGSKPWLLARALDGEGETRPLKGTEGGAGGDKSGRDRGAVGGVDDEEALPEDRFHLKLPKGQGCFVACWCLLLVLAACCVESWTPLTLGGETPDAWWRDCHTASSG